MLTPRCLDRIERRQRREHAAAQHHGQSVAAAEFDQADEQAAQHHANRISVCGPRTGRGVIVASPRRVHAACRMFPRRRVRGRREASGNQEADPMSHATAAAQDSRAAQPPAVPRRSCRQPAAAARAGGGPRRAQGRHAVSRCPARHRGSLHRGGNPPAGGDRAACRDRRRVSPRLLAFRFRCRAGWRGAVRARAEDPVQGRPAVCRSRCGSTAGSAGASR